MASPVADSYSCASGGVIAGGRYHLPAWRRAMTAGRWAQIGSNSMFDIDPEDNAAINPNYPANAPWHANSGTNGLTAWSSGAFDETSQQFVTWGGGHTDYAGNEVYGIDLGADAPAWALLRNPTGAIGNTGTLDDALESTDVYFDGRPRSQHTYGNLAIVDGVLWALPGGSEYKSGDGVAAVFSFDLLAKDWTNHGGPVSIYSTTLYGGSCDYDATRGAIWSVGYNKVVKYTISTNTYASPSGLGGISGGEFNCKYHAGFDLLVIFRHSIDSLLYDPVANTLHTMTLTGTAPSFSWGHCGMQWEAENNRYVMWDGGADFATLTPPATNPKTNAWTWGVLAADAGNTVTPTAESTGTWGRFFRSEKYRCYGVQNAVSQKLYVFAID